MREAIIIMPAGMSDADWKAACERAVEHLTQAFRHHTAVEPAPQPVDGYMTTRDAAAYLGMTPNAVHKLTAARSIPFAQPGGPGGKCYFLRSELDEWRRG